MDGLTLLLDARRAGLEVTVRDDQLVLQGPRRLEPLAKALIAEKPLVLAALAEEHEVEWRVAAMRPQVTATGAIPLLLARPGAPWSPGRCCSCGDPLSTTDRYRCRPCVVASTLVLEAVR